MHISDVDIRLLRVFMTVVRCGGFTPAQGELNISQSTISNHMATLETRLGVRLCERGRAGFRLTEQGRALYRSADKLFLSLDHFRAEAASLRAEVMGELRIGIVDGTVSDPKSPLVQILRRLARFGRNVRPILQVDDPQELERSVATRRLDAAVGVFRSIEGLSKRPFYEERHEFYCGSGHPLFAKPAVTLEDVRKCRLVSRSYWNVADLARFGVSSPGAVVNSMEGELALILTGEFLGFLPLHMAEPWVGAGQMRALSDLELGFEARISILALRDARSHSFLLSEFLKAAEEHRRGVPKRR